MYIVHQQTRWSNVQRAVKTWFLKPSRILLHAKTKQSWPTGLAHSSFRACFAQRPTSCTLLGHVPLDFSTRRNKCTSTSNGKFQETHTIMTHTHKHKITDIQHTHTHTHARTHARTHTQAHTENHANTNVYKITDAHTNAHAHTHSHKIAQTHTQNNGQTHKTRDKTK